MSRSAIRSARVKTFLAAALAGVAVTAVAGAGTAVAGVEADAVVKARGSQENMHFDPRVVDIPSGGLLKIANRTREPHTLSLVEREDVPDTGAEIRNCFFGICGLIFEAHKKEKPGPGFARIVREGAPGLNKSFVMPNTYGDSVYINQNPRQIEVTDPSGATQWFMCGIHPWMHGRFNVQ